MRFVTEDLPPFQYLDRGNLVGLNAEKVQAAVKLAGIPNPAFAVYPWARAYELALHHKNTFIFSIARTAERETQFVWVAELAAYQFAFFSRCDANLTLANLQDALRYHVVVLRDDMPHHFLKAHGFNDGQHLEVMTSFDSTFNFFFHGRADLIVSSNEVIAAMAKKQDVDPQLWCNTLTIPELGHSLYLAANTKTDPELIEKLRNAFGQLTPHPDHLPRQ